MPYLGWPNTFKRQTHKFSFLHHILTCDSAHVEIVFVGYYLFLIIPKSYPAQRWCRVITRHRWQLPKIRCTLAIPSHLECHRHYFIGNIPKIRHSRVLHLHINCILIKQYTNVCLFTLFRQPRECRFCAKVYFWVRIPPTATNGYNLLGKGIIILSQRLGYIKKSSCQNFYLEMLRSFVFFVAFDSCVGRVNFLWRVKTRPYCFNSLVNNFKPVFMA
jgi:hypothetical protein